MSVEIKCGYPDHAGQSNRPGWDDGILASADSPLLVLCRGCSRIPVAVSAERSNNDLLRTRASAAKTRIAGIRTQMATITGTSGTLTAAQLSNAARAIAAAVDDLARIDAALIRLALGDFTDTTDSA